MSAEKPQAVHRLDYTPPDYFIDTVDLDFDLHEEETIVRAALGVRRNPELRGDPPPLVLDGEHLELRHIAIDGAPLPDSQWEASDEKLTVDRVPERFTLETEVRIRPHENTALSGLYKSGSMFCTQCEAMGFRRITYFLDRPDVMARYSTTITADAERYPILLSNGNRVDVETGLEGGRHRVRWEDPFKKPSYLFALVAGDLRCHEGAFTTKSGRDVKLEIWVEPENIDKCEHALGSLQRAMKWDEDVFGLEYDLDIYMIVAVNDFNMGAMENKGLNVFNSKYVLAKPETATDTDYEGIEGVIGHEYFHNWTGNRVTCRDWFQLTLKEGLTVFRDQQFSGDMGSAAVKRIDEVNVLRAAQFPEDAGPMSHPIRPESYISMDNFYTPTVYNKGAEVIRMYHTLLGADGFRRGMDLYFDRHDGDAVTCDDFRAAMADANGRDLELFGRWYSQPGTPELHASESFDAATGTYSLTLRQDYPETTHAVEGAADRKPLHMPVATGLLGPGGAELALKLEGEADAPAAGTRVLELTEAEQTFVFDGLGVSEKPVASLLRDFSAPVRLRMERPRAELAFLLGHDADPFNRWEAGQTLATELLLEAAPLIEERPDHAFDPVFVEAMGRVLADESLDGSLKALALTLPAERIVGQEMEVIDPTGVHLAREALRRAVGAAHAGDLRAAYDARAGVAYSNDRGAIDDRRLKNVALAYLAVTGDEGVALAEAQYDAADNMTDSAAALSLLVDFEGDARDRALAHFYERWQHDPLVVDKWFTVQAMSRAADTVERVQALQAHPAFGLDNPNRVRSLIASFCAGNAVHFHRLDGAGYDLLAETVLELDGRNPQLAARLVSVFNQWKRYDAQRQALMGARLKRIADKPGLSKDVFEIVGRALGD